MMKLVFVRSEEDHYFYIQCIDNRIVIVALYVDDMFFSNIKDTISELKFQLLGAFEMKDVGAARYIMGMEIRRDQGNRKLWLSQTKYVNTISHKFNM